MLPQPKSFVRFARAFMMDNGLEVVPKLLPLPLHNAYQTARWSIGATYTRIKHKGFIKKQLKGLDPEVNLKSGPKPQPPRLGLVKKRVPIADDGTVQ